MGLTRSENLVPSASEASTGPLVNKAATDALFRNSRATCVGNVTTAFLVVVALWFDERFNAPFGLWWVGLVFLVDYLRLLLSKRYEKADSPDPLHWARLHMWGACLQGAVWNIAGFVLIPFDSPVLPSLYLVISGATTAGSLSLNSTYMPSLRGYMWAKLGLLSLRLAMEPEVPYWVLAASVLFYCLFLVRLGRSLNEILLTSFRLRFSQEKLVERLSEAQLELQNSHEDLELRVKERTRSLERETSTRIEMERRLHRAQRMEAVGRLTGGVAHDFNNSLTVIQNCLEHVELELNRSLPSIATAKQAVASGASLTKNLLVFSRQTNLVASVFDVRSAVESIATGILRRALPSNIDVQVSYPKHPGHVNVDRSQLESSLLNLALNSRDAMPNGGELQICVSFLDHEAVIAVIDNGSGMPPQVVERVFEPFFSTKGDKGTGLGLSMVYGFVRQSGGDVSIESSVAGTSVELRLPLVESSQISSHQASSKPQALETLHGHDETILLVEDNDSLRNSTEAILVRLGYTVLQACDVQSALAILRDRNDIQLILSDVRMPGRLSGRDLARKVQSTWPHIKVLIMTGYAPSAPDGLMSQIIHKPFTMLQLASRIRSELSPTSAVASSPDSMPRD